jgi:hypothetical protein
MCIYKFNFLNWIGDEDWKLKTEKYDNARLGCPTIHGASMDVRRGAKVFGFIKKTTSHGIENMYLFYIFPLSSTHTYDFVVLTSLTHSRKILLVVLQIGK